MEAMNSNVLAKIQGAKDSLADCLSLVGIKVETGQDDSCESIKTEWHQKVYSASQTLQNISDTIPFGLRRNELQRTKTGDVNAIENKIGGKSYTHIILLNSIQCNITHHSLTVLIKIMYR
jgi:hypothetical protein